MKYPFRIFPVGPNKAPLISDWRQKATRDTHTIAQWKANGAAAWGIPCGADNGLFVIDLDVDKSSGEAVGEASLKALPRYARLLEKANVNTPSGGRHIYCRHFDGARNTTSKIGRKIDTRGEGGYVVAPGSITEGGAYRGFVPSVLPAVPPGLRAMFLQVPVAPPPRAPARQTPKGEVEELLSHIPADLPYLDWVTVLMALHDRFAGSDEGLALADQWSAAGVKYRPGEVAAKWRSFKRSGITWATVPAMARQHGADLSEIARRWAA
ncbi:bifunctional DNA primase/polymerase [Roseibacterium sp. SDUM158017]|uniref:bifunctional DNA primase/polymerase n=1 Tax=Roseicyclus salinarum TaxID=3036773 RepID=UPI0024155A69|nr:bifunctional DNA primase/polymerase [Roseibacterium sp. SDUM158017]MDG4649463.1 bifunctional DNA primase/polymerase [Roseibacterium sp. SDUM158017]